MAQVIAIEPPVNVEPRPLCARAYYRKTHLCLQVRIHRGALQPLYLLLHLDLLVRVRDGLELHRGKRGAAALLGARGRVLLLLLLPGAPRRRPAGSS